MDQTPELLDAILNDEISSAREAFRKSVAQKVAELSSTDNRFSTALLSFLEALAKEELRRRAAAILACSTKLTPPSLISLGLDTLGSWAQDRLLGEKADIEAVIAGVDMGKIQRHASFLDEVARSSSGRLGAELAALVHAASSSELDVAAEALIPMNPQDLDSRLQIFRREAFDRDLASWATSAVESGECMALLMLDLDRFKSINDQHGHPVGDEVLESVSRLLRRIVGTKGTCYRYGGEELCVLLSNYTADEGAALAERIRAQIEQVPISSKQLRVTASFGVADLPGHALSAAELVKKADEALYEAKNLGRNLVRVSGESVPTETSLKSPVRRRQPVPGGLSDEEAETIRQDYFRRGSAECPKDGARLNVNRSDTHDRNTPTLFILCPLCGLRTKIEGPS